MMPSGGAPHRGTVATITGLMHDKLSDPAVGQWVADPGDTTDPICKAAVRNIGRDRSRREGTHAPRGRDRRRQQCRIRRLDEGEEAMTSVFQAALERLVELRREISHLGEAENPYDHLLDQYDPGSTTAQLQPMFARLRRELAGFLDDVKGRRAGSGTGPGTSPCRSASRRGHRCHGRLNDGRLDASEHPFTVGMGTGDVRLTTHLYEDDLLGGLTGTIHEAGHGMYEQGLPSAHAGTGLSAAGMGLHESQSRFWENVIGRSLPFFEWLVPRIHAHFPGDTLSPQDWFGHANRIERSFIRVQADEATYNLHIIIRFELGSPCSWRVERRRAARAWNQAYTDLLGITPATLTRCAARRPGQRSLRLLPELHHRQSLRRQLPLPDGGGPAADVDRCRAGRVHTDSGLASRPRTRHGHILDAPQIFTQAEPRPGRRPDGSPPRSSGRPLRLGGERLLDRCAQLVAVRTGC